MKLFNMMKRVATVAVAFAFAFAAPAAADFASGNAAGIGSPGSPPSISGNSNQSPPWGGDGPRGVDPMPMPGVEADPRPQNPVGRPGRSNPPNPPSISGSEGNNPPGPPGFEAQPPSGSDPQTPPGFYAPPPGDRGSSNSPPNTSFSGGLY